MILQTDQVRCCALDDLGKRSIGLNGFAVAIVRPRLARRDVRGRLRGSARCAGSLEEGRPRWHRCV